MKFWRHSLVYLLLPYVYGCCTLPETGVSIDKLSTQVANDQSVTTVMTQRSAKVDSFYYRPDYKGNILTENSSTQLNFSDQTVFLGNYIAWQAIRYLQSYDPSSFANMQKAFSHIRNALTVPSNLPGQTALNYGYFMRDNVDFSSIQIEGVTYSVNSDYQNGTDNEMSQDQMIHVLFGYHALLRSLAQQQSSEAQQLRQAVADHADQIGLRLKAYNYIVTTPEGQPVKRGPDARFMAWPLAQGISMMTGKPIETYLDTVTMATLKNGKQLVLNREELKDLWKTGLEAIYEGVCDIKVGDDHHELCNRFDLALFNSLYVMSRSDTLCKCYVKRMESDGDWYRSAMARLAIGQEKLPANQYQVLQSAVGVDFSTQTQPQLWCYMSRWIFFPSQCPQSGDPVYLFNAVDFLSLRDLIVVAPKWGQP